MSEEQLIFVLEHDGTSVESGIIGVFSSPAEVEVACRRYCLQEGADTEGRFIMSWFTLNDPLLWPVTVTDWVV